MDSQPRSRVKPLLALGAGLIALTVLIIAAVMVENDGVDTLLGFVTGMLLVVLLAGMALMVLRRRFRSRRRDEAILDGLEPLRRPSERDARGTVDGA